MMFKLAFELSLGLFWGAFVGYLPFVILKARITKHSTKNAIDAPATGVSPDGLDMAALMRLGAQLMGKGQ